VAKKTQFDSAAYYAELGANPTLNDLVGGSDGRAVGEASLSLLESYGLPVDQEAVLCDFGCGVGRGTAAVAARINPRSTLLGIDIVPELINFCETNIGAYRARTDFRLLKAKNDHYQRHVDLKRLFSTNPQSRKKILSTYAGRVDFLWAFSVFTHLDAESVEDSLRFVRNLLAKDGRALLTAFVIDSDVSRSISAGTTTYGLEDGIWDGGLFHANQADPLAFVGFNHDYLLDYVAEAGLVPLEMVYGTWRDSDRPSRSFQDALLVTPAP